MTTNHPAIEQRRLRILNVGDVVQVIGDAVWQPAGQKIYTQVVQQDYIQGAGQKAETAQVAKAQYQHRNIQHQHR